MKTFYRINITYTWKFPFSKEDYQISGSEEKTFATIEECREFLKGEYGTSKRSKMYVDHTDGAKHIGFIYHTKGWSDRDYYGLRYFVYRQDWINIEKISTEPVILKGVQHDVNRLCV